jgi:BirA family transcriptional regulator, biotin operon repressor / biotin---[acetyl-CoA-carboxylase] ligase
MLDIKLKNNLIYLKSIDSTNNYLANLLKESNVPNFTVVVTESQTSGRGQRGTNWIGEDYKNIYLSILLDNLPYTAWETSMKTALGIQLCVKNYCKESDVRIKWPNDIYIGSSKCAGILIENKIKAKTKKLQSIVGIGLNVNQKIFPSDISATSISLEKNQDYNLKHIFNNLLEYLEEIYSSPFSAKSLYKSKLIGHNEYKTYLYQNQEVQAQILDIMDDGRALFKIENSLIKTMDLKEIKLLA